MAWIESHQALRNHPKVARLCLHLGASKAEAIGHLHLLWWAALDYAQDGDLSRFDPAEIADMAAWEPGEDEDQRDVGRFLDALQKAGFIDQDKRLHDWHDYVRGIAEARERRKEDGIRGNHHRWHQGKPNPKCPLCIAPPMAPESPPDGPRIARTVPTEPNRTEPRTQPLPLSGADQVEAGFDSFWSYYPKRVGKEAARKVWKRLRPDQATLARMLAAVQRQAQGEQWRREHGRFIPNPATWLNEGRWDDEGVRDIAKEAARLEDARSEWAMNKRRFESAYWREHRKDPTPEEIEKAIGRKP